MSSPSLTAFTASEGSITTPRWAFILETFETKLRDITLCIAFVNAWAFKKAAIVSELSIKLSCLSPSSIWVGSTPLMSLSKALINTPK